MSFVVFLFGIALVVTIACLVAALARVREKDKVIRDLSSKIFELRRSGTGRHWPVTNPVSSVNRRTRPNEAQQDQQEREELQARMEQTTGELARATELIQKFEKGFLPYQFRESNESKALRDKLQESLLQEKPQRSASELLGRIHEICSGDKDLKRDSAVKSGTTIYNWVNELKAYKSEKEKLLLSYRDWLNKQIKPFGIYSAIVHEGEAFAESLHDANGYGSCVRKVHSLAFYQKKGQVYKKARITSGTPTKIAQRNR